MIKQESVLGGQTWRVMLYDVCYEITHFSKGGIQYFKKDDTNDNVELAKQE